MATRQDIPAGVLFIGENKKLRVRNITGDDGLPLDVDGMTFTFTLKDDPASETALITKTSAANQVRVGGVFDSNPADNTQYVEADIDDADTNPLYKGKFHYSVRRADIGAKTVLAWGTVQLDQAG